jgi:putative peptidoglycan lipid II flippase
MLKRILNGQSKTITGAAILISGASLISRLVGLIRESIFANYYGISYIMDAYYAAFKLPDLVYNLLIVGAISAGFIPIFVKLLINQGKNSAWKLANNIVNILGILIFVLTILGIIFMPRLMPIFAPGFDNNTMQLAVSFGRIMFISMFILSISMIMGTILQSLRSFLLFSIAPIFYNIGIIAGVIGLVPYFGITGIAWGVVLGSTMHFILQTYGAYQHGYRWKPIINLKDTETKKIGLLTIPRTMALAINQINIVVITIIATVLPVGSVAVYNYAHNLQSVPIGIIAIPFALAVFPVLSESAAKKDIPKFIKNLSHTITQILFLTIPLSIILVLLRAQIVRVIYGRGQFGWEATINTADTLALFALSLFAQSLIPLLGRAFYALENTKTPFIIAFISELITIIAALVFKDMIGVAGLALAFSIGAIVNFAMLAVALRGITKDLDEHRIFSSFWKISIAALVMSLIIQFSKYPLAKIVDHEKLWGIFTQGFVAGILGLVAYASVCYILKLPEFRQFWGSFKRRWLRLRGIELEEGIELK